MRPKLFKPPLVCSYFICFLMFFFKESYGQDTIRISYDSVKKKFVTHSFKGLKKNRSYSFELIGIHNGVMIPRIDINSFIQYTKAPGVLDFLSIPSTDEIRFDQLQTLHYNDENNEIAVLIENEIDKYERNDSIFEVSNKLISNLLKDWQNGELNNDSYVKEAKKIIGIIGVEDINSEIQNLRQGFKYSQVVKAVIDTYLNETTITDKTVLRNYAIFLAKLETAIQNSNIYINTLKTIYSIHDNPDIYLCTKQIGGNYYNYWTGTSFSAKGDLSKINLLLLNRQNSDTIQQETFDFYTYNYFKFDFSTGFYWNKLTNYTYSVFSYNEDSTSVTLQRDNNRNTDIAIGGQLHFSYKWRPFVGIGANIGAAISVLDGSTKYLMGGHLIFGKSKQAVVSAGWAVGKVKRISDRLKEDPGYSELEDGKFIVAPSSFEDPKMVDQVKHSVFIGFSYNLSSIFKSK